MEIVRISVYCSYFTKMAECMGENYTLGYSLMQSNIQTEHNASDGTRHLNDTRWYANPIHLIYSSTIGEIRGGSLGTRPILGPCTPCLFLHTDHCFFQRDADLFLFLQATFLILF